MEIEMTLTPAEALALVARLKFRSFDINDKRAFPGCESDDPQIAYSQGMAVLLDGEFIEVYVSRAGAGEKIFQFHLIEPNFIFKTGRDD